MKQQEISQDTPYPLIAFSFRTFHLCMSSGHYCMEFFGLRMPLLDKPTLLPQLDLLFPSRLVGIQNPPIFNSEQMAVLSQSAQCLPR